MTVGAHAPAAVRDGTNQHTSHPLDAAILRAVAFADVFDHAATPDELVRHLTVPASADAVARRLAVSPSLTRSLVMADGHVVPAGRERLVEERHERRRTASRLWPRARRFGRLLGSLPFVRMVAVTGSLAAGGPRPGADIDLFVVAAAGRVWLARALVVAVVRLARLLGVELCPNYVLSEAALALPGTDRTYGTAREIAQMVPLSGEETYREFLDQNAWYRVFQPNHVPHPAGPSARPSRLRRFVEAAGRSRAFDRLEQWEMRRKVGRFAATARSSETRYDADCCKGHVEGHAARASAAWEARADELLERSAAR